MKIKLGQTVKVVECGCNHKGVHNGLMGKVANFWDNGDVDVSLPKDVCFARKVTTLKPKPMKRIKKECCLLLSHLPDCPNSPKPSKIEIDEELINRLVIHITEGVFHIIGWEKKYSAKEKQALNDKVDKYLATKIVSVIKFLSH